MTDLRAAFDAADPEPIIALLEPLATPERRARLDAVLRARLDAVTVVMDAPHDPHNGAAVLRSADAFGVQRVHVVERDHAFGASSAVAKGAERWVDVITHRSAAEAIAALHASAHRLVGTHPAGKLVPEDLRGIQRLALVMGNEHDGICDELDAACEEHVRVPMRGFVESLNVSVSAAILLSHAARERHGDLGGPAGGLAFRRLYARWLALSVPRSLEILAAREIHLTLCQSDIGLLPLKPQHNNL